MSRLARYVLVFVWLLSCYYAAIWYHKAHPSESLFGLPVRAPAAPTAGDAYRRTADAAAIEVVAQFAKAGAVRKYQDEASVTVGPAFFSLEMPEKERLCAALSGARDFYSLRRDFLLLDPWNGNEIGHYWEGALSMR